MKKETGKASYEPKCFKPSKGQKPFKVKKTDINIIIINENV